MKIRIEVEGTPITANLEDNETARDFAALLPLTLTLRDHAETERISDLPRRLSTDGAPAGTAASAGDISYYAPWGNLALFHRRWRRAAARGGPAGSDHRTRRGVRTAGHTGRLSALPGGTDRDQRNTSMT